MFRLLLKKFIKDPENTGSPEVRAAYGSLCGVFGIVMNLLLFAAKLAAGIISGSIAVTADSINNLSDAGSSLITLFGFRLASQKPDHEHPFGHGRIEYVAGLLVSVLIIVMGVELGKSSVERIIHPAAPDFSAVVLIILAVSAAVKLYMFFCYRSAGKKIRSKALFASANDSLSDMISTFAVLISSLICMLFDVNLDPYFGLAVAAFILKAGISSVIDTVNPLLGQPPEPEFVDKIKDTVMSYPEVIGVHDLIVHDYGPGRKMLSLHAEVPASGDIVAIHDTVDNIEKQLKDELGCEAVIHMDPVMSDDPLTCELGAKIRELVNGISPELSIHDFRIVSGATHTNLIFDLVIPYDFEMSEASTVALIKERTAELDKNFYCVINVDRAYVEREKKGKE